IFGRNASQQGVVPGSELGGEAVENTETALAWDVDDEEIAARAQGPKRSLEHEFEVFDVRRGAVEEQEVVLCFAEIGTFCGPDLHAHTAGSGDCSHAFSGLDAVLDHDIVALQDGFKESGSAAH